MDSKTLLNDIAVIIGRDKQDVVTLLNAFVGVLRKYCSVGNSIAVPGFGTYEVVKTDEEISTDQNSGKRLLLPPHISLNFRPSALLRSKCHAVNQAEDISSSTTRTKVAFPELVEAVAKATNTTNEISESFLRQLFASISESLRNGQNVAVAELGIFKITQIDEVTKSISFEPDKQLAAQINAPFASFVPVEIADDVSLDQIEAAVDVTDESLESVKGDNPESCENEKGDSIEPDESIKTDESLTPDDSPVSDIAELSTETEKVTEEIEPCSIDQENNDADEKAGEEEETPSDAPAVADERYTVPEVHEEEEYLPEPEKIGNQFVRGFLWGALTMFLLYIIVGAAIYFYVSRDSAEQENSSVELSPEVHQNEENVSPEDNTLIDDKEILFRVDSALSTNPDNNLVAVTNENTAQIVPETDAKQAAPAPTKNVVVLDTITNKMYLSRISKKHYGHSDFWGYIYEENKAKLGNPNKIPPGTVVVIPPAEKYGIDPNNKESLARARAKITSILKKYN